MSLDRSLKSANSLVRHRNVLTRDERLTKLKEMEKWTDGRQTRLVNTDDFLAIAEEESKMELDWFFEMYLRQPKLPKLVTETSGGMFLRWETPNNMPFPMPIDVVVNGKTQRVNMKNGRATVTGAGITIDPNAWVLRTQ